MCQINGSFIRSFEVSLSCSDFLGGDIWRNVQIKYLEYEKAAFQMVWVSCESEKH